MNLYANSSITNPDNNNNNNININDEESSFADYCGDDLYFNVIIDDENDDDDDSSYISSSHEASESSNNDEWHRHYVSSSFCSFNNNEQQNLDKNDSPFTDTTGVVESNVVFESNLVKNAETLLHGMKRRSSIAQQQQSSLLCLRKVTFNTTIFVREYSITVGSLTASSHSCPIQLSWEYNEIELQYFEETTSYCNDNKHQVYEQKKESIVYSLNYCSSLHQNKSLIINNPLPSKLAKVLDHPLQSSLTSNATIPYRKSISSTCGSIPIIENENMSLTSLLGIGLRKQQQHLPQLLKQPINDNSTLVDKSIFSLEDSFSNNDEQMQQQKSNEESMNITVVVSPRKIRRLTSKQRRIRLANVNGLSIDQIKMLELDRLIEKSNQFLQRSLQVLNTNTYTNSNTNTTNTQQQQEEYIIYILIYAFVF